MNKDLSQEKRDTLASEFTYQGKKPGMIGGYCEEDFPLYYANEEMAELLGYGSVEELAAGIGGRVANTIHPDDMPRVEKDLGGHFYEGMTYETTYRMPRRDGSWFWTVDKGKVIRAEDGRLAILSVCTDMSAFVQRQQELESKNTVSDHLFKNLPGGYVRCGISEGLPFLYIGERFLNMLGWTEEEVRTKFDNKFANMLCPEDLGITKDHVDKILRGGIESPNGDVIYRILGKDGYHWVSDTTVKAELPGGTFLQCIISDVSRFMTEREQREAELERHLKASEERYEIIRALGTVYQDISVIDLKAQTYMLISGRGRSEQYQGHIGPSEEFKDLVLNRIIAPSQHEEAGRFLDFSTAAARLWDKKFITCEFRGRNGAWYLVTLIAKTRDEGGEVTHVLVSARNIDEQKTKELEYQKDLEEGVAEARRANEAKTNFLHRMSHDIRTPLNGIIGLLKINESHFDDRALLLENHEKMSVAADHLLSLINDVLQMSKLEDGSIVLTRDIVNIIIGRAVEAGIEWDYEKDKSFIPYPYIYGSPVHLRQIFLNIYGNCIKYNRPGGKITTIVDMLEERGNICTYRWIITDTGIGMSQEFLKHIFEPFAQKKNDARSAYQGTGLGMPIVKSLLDQMGGSIEITSEVGVGSTFVIVIPFEIAPPPEAAEEHPVPEQAGIRGLHLLLAEDNELNAKIA